jgi:hypothetical protein
MNKHQRVPIIRKQWGTIYGRVVNTSGKLGNYEVISDQFGHDTIVYARFAEAERKLEHYEFMFGKKNN